MHLQQPTPPPSPIDPSSPQTPNVNLRAQAGSRIHQITVPIQCSRTLWRCHEGRRRVQRTPLRSVHAHQRNSGASSPPHRGLKAPTATWKVPKAESCASLPIPSCPLTLEDGITLAGDSHPRVSGERIGRSFILRGGSLRVSGHEGSSGTRR